MHALFASVKKRRITNIKLKKVLNVSSTVNSLEDLQSQLENEKCYEINLKTNIINKFKIVNILKYSLSGLYFIKKVDLETKEATIVVSDMLVNDYKGYMKLFNKEFKNKKFLIKNNKYTKDVHNVLTEKKRIKFLSFLNRIILRILPGQIFPVGFSNKDMSKLLKHLDKKGKQGNCIKNIKKYATIKPDICINYFDLVVRNPGREKFSIPVGNISNAMGKPKLKTKKLKKTRAEKKIKNDAVNAKIKRKEQQRYKRMQLKKKLRKDMRKERRRKEKRMLKRMKNERMSNVTEFFANKLKIKKKDNILMVLMRAVILTVLTLSFLSVTNSGLYNNMLHLIKLPAKSIQNILKN